MPSISFVIPTLNFATFLPETLDSIIAEAHFPEHVEIASGILRIGNSSWDIASAAFQGGECKATCITTIVLTDANGPTAIPQDLRGEFERLHVKLP